MFEPISGWSPRSSIDADERDASGLSAGTSKHVRVAHQLEHVEGPVGERGAAECEIELARLDQAVQLGIGGRLGQSELDPGPVGHEPPHHLGEHARADRLVRPDAQRSRLAGAQRGDVGARGVEPRDDRLGVAEQHLARIGERDGTRAAGPLDERLADDPLERRDLLADGGLRVAEPVGGATERPLARDRVEGREVADLDAEPLIRFCDRLHEYLDLS